ncbi:MAG TPA: hypothetical protein VF599_14440 [Pyrinomonadaceae bacterium]|jgi:hypothetical protein
MRTSKIFRIVLFLSFLNAAAVIAAAQLPIDLQIRMEIEERKRREQQFERLRNIGGVRGRKVSDTGSASRPAVKPTEKDLEAIAVSAEDTSRFAAFLKQPRTGIFRFHDISKCEESQKVYNVEEPCPAHIPEKGSAYSFLEEDYEVRLLADISLEKSTFRVRKLGTLSFLTDLGDAPLENLTVGTDGIREMAEFVPSLDKKVVVAQYKIASKGFQVGKHIYKTSHPLKENSTYALRSIAYRMENRNLSVKTKRLDVIVIFRVVRTHGDGSVSILWKELQRKEAPKLISNKLVADGKSDIKTAPQKFTGN